MNRRAAMPDNLSSPARQSEAMEDEEEADEGAKSVTEAVDV